MPNPGSWKVIVAQPYARAGTYADGWNDRALGKPPRPGVSMDYDLGYTEAVRFKITSEFAFNQVLVIQ